MNQLPASIFISSLILLSNPAVTHGQKNTYPTKFYVIHSDLDPVVVREAALRMSLMVDEYRSRTQGSSGALNQRLPFYLFRNAEDYYRNGGMPGSIGVFTGDRLMAIAGAEGTEQTWHVVQHEGFHQFVRAVIRGDVPVWINEGLAEYFGEAVFTGDDYVTGLIPPERAARIKEMIKSDRFKTIGEMMRLEHLQWNLELNFENYDMAWSMIHFLGHAQGGKYQSRFQRFIRDVSYGMEWERAWLKNFNGNTESFERMWRKYWTEMPERPTADRYARATVATLTGYLARAVARRRRFETAQAFLAEAKDGRITTGKDDWLPPGLLRRALARAEQTGTWELRNPRSRAPMLVCTTAGGTEIVGSFKVARGKVAKVTATITGKDDGNGKPKRGRRTLRRQRP